MTYFVKAKWIDPLFAAVNALFPNRLHEQDGTVGDLAHTKEKSGHNPDDTPGLQAERQDSDNIPEVRAADVDARGVDMDSVVHSVVGYDNPDRRKLIYVIWNRHIWHAANGWVREDYHGTDPHDKHAHFSGDPASDDDGSQWSSLITLSNGAEEDMTPAQETKLDILIATLSRVDGRLTTILYNFDTNPYFKDEKGNEEKNALKAQLLELKAATSPVPDTYVGKVTVSLEAPPAA